MRMNIKTLPHPSKLTRNLLLQLKPKKLREKARNLLAFLNGPGFARRKDHSTTWHAAPMKGSCLEGEGEGEGDVKDHKPGETLVSLCPLELMKLTLLIACFGSRLAFA